MIEREVGPASLLLPLGASLVLLAGGSDPAGAQEAGVCREAVQGEIAWNYEGETRWSANNVRRLCRGAEDSTGPARCFQRVMHGGVDWGGGTRWSWRNALGLCQGTRDPGATVACFRRRVDGGAGWREAIDGCRARATKDERVPLEDETDVQPRVTLPGPGPEAQKRPDVTPDVVREMEIEASPWEGNLEIVGVEMKGPVGSRGSSPYDPPAGLFGREYAAELRVRNVSARAVRVEPMYLVGGRLRSTAARVDGEPWGDGSVNLPAGRVTTVPVVFDLAGLSGEAREDVLFTERFRTTLFLADPHASGETLEERIFEDRDMDDHRRDVRMRVLVPYEARLRIDRIVIRHPCTEDHSAADRLLLVYLGNSEGRVPLENASQLRSYTPGTTVTLSGLLSNEDLSMQFAVMPARTAPDGSWSSVAEGRVRLTPPEWNRAEPVVLEESLEPTSRCAVDSPPVEIEATLRTIVP